jgi:tRNA 2-thiouridine synthesizing protein A
MAAPKSASNTDTLLDVQGLTCPLPVLKANKVLRGLPAGARLTILATDAASVADFQAFCRETGHALVSFSENAGVYRYTLRKRDEAPRGPGGAAPERPGGDKPAS